MIFTSLAPNTESDDARLAWRLLFQPWRWKRGDATKRLEATLAQRIGVSHAISFESGRTTLEAILKASGITGGDEVLLQAYTCVAVPDPVLWVGAKPVYVDIDETLTMSVEDLEKKIIPAARAVIIQHTFGVPAHLTELIAVARKHNLLVIEDCAHALGSLYKGKPVGSFGDAAFFSFGRDKSISSVFGGMAVTNNMELAAKLRHIQGSYPLPSLFWIKQQLLHPIIFNFARTTYSFGGKLLIGLSKALQLTSRAVYPEEKQGKQPRFIRKQLANALAMLALHQLSKLDEFTAHRKKIAAIYQSLLEIPAQAVPGEADVAWLRYTILTEKAEGIRLAVKKEAAQLGDWYDTAIAPRGTSYEAIGYHSATCPRAEQAAAQSINLPTDIHISEADALRIVSLIKQHAG